MICKNEPYLIEYNIRMGDPECQVLMMRLKTDLFKIIKYAKVIKIYGRTGLGGVTQVLVRLIDEPKRTLIRNIKGPIRLNDIITLLEWEREARIKK